MVRETPVPKERMQIQWIRIPVPKPDRDCLARYKPLNTSWGKYLVELLHHKLGADVDYDNKILRNNK